MLPAIALATIPFAVIFRITRASVLDVLDEDYVRTAESKGLTDRVIRTRHVMRNALLPVVTTIGLQVGGLLAGAVLTETVFSSAGSGRRWRWPSRGATTRCCRC
jgi:peptide/nickel transport system permease protein